MCREVAQRRSGRPDYTPPVDLFAFAVRGPLRGPWRGPRAEGAADTVSRRD